ncbi:Uncharacterised protein [Yersinia similis]|uniref:Uncharacterized protein n=1 Tax=Yersinia similis TaxID=367190 RepID=A0A0T9NXE8_9GAMM|nr:Uncharacterised protein [Yersinia similis]CNF06356.1 Uncharacterised protein [Yersinia similis]CNH33464.1 Uncharacterised protein [Yersinia similis]
MLIHFLGRIRINAEQRDGPIIKNIAGDMIATRNMPQEVSDNWLRPACLAL